MAYAENTTVPVKREYSVYMIGRSTVCPVCSGMAVIQKEKMIKCIDCGKIFRVKGIGQTEREIVCTYAGRNGIR